MLSVKSSAVFTTPVISLEALARAFDLKAPVSVTKLIQQALAPASKVLTGVAKAGDATCAYSFAIAKNGLWSVSGSVTHDNAILGDSYQLDWLLPDGTQINASSTTGKLGNQITGNQTQTFATGGFSQDISNKWSSVEASGIQVRFTVTSDPTTLVDVIVSAAIAGLLIVIGAGSAKSCAKATVVARPADPATPGDSGTATLHIDTTQCP